LQELLLAGVDPATCSLIKTGSRAVVMPAGAVLFRPGGLCEQFFIVLEGAVRVHRLTRSGREMTLYHVLAGQTCIMTTLCLLADDAYSAGAVVEADVRALAVPASRFNALMHSSRGFRRLVFNGYAQRLTDLLARIEMLTDVPVEARLAAFLLARANDSASIAITHQAMATEIGTAREVVSRVLEHLAEQGCVRLARGRVQIVHRQALAKLAEAS